jgi:hypothetical protein
MKRTERFALSVIMLFLTLSMALQAQSRSSPAADRLAADGWDVAELDTGAESDYLSASEKDTLLVMNAVRKDPPRFAELYLTEYRSWYSGTRLRIPGQVELMTNEGVSAADECLRVLKKQKPLPLLAPSKGMSRAARDHAEWQGKTGKTGHTGAGGSDPWARMNKYGVWLDAAGENISYGFGTGFLVILQLLVDDGVSSRGHRDNILSPDFYSVGIGMSTHTVYGHVAVIDYSGGFREKQ